MRDSTHSILAGTVKACLTLESRFHFRISRLCWPVLQRPPVSAEADMAQGNVMALRAAGGIDMGHQRGMCAQSSDWKALDGLVFGTLGTRQQCVLWKEHEEKGETGWASAVF